MLYHRRITDGLVVRLGNNIRLRRDRSLLIFPSRPFPGNKNCVWNKHKSACGGDEARVRGLEGGERYAVGDSGM